MTDVTPQIVNNLDAYVLTIPQGKNFDLTFACQVSDTDATPIPLTGYVAEGQVREYAGGPLLAEFNCVVDAVNGGVTASLTPSQTRAIKQRSVYEIKLVAGAAEVICMHGDVRLIPEVAQ